MLRSIGYVLLVLGLGCALEFPSYIIRCKEDEIETCGPEAANAAIPYFLHGDSRYGIPSFIPFQLGETEIIEPHMKFHLRRCELSGLESIHVYKTKWNRPTGSLSFSVDKLSLTGEFPIGGTLYDASFPRAGVANFTLYNVKVSMEILYKVERVNSDQNRFDQYRLNFEVDPKSSYYTFSEFYSGVPYVAIKDSAAVNKMILPKFKSALRQVFMQSSGRLTSLFPAEAFFLPNYY